MSDIKKSGFGPFKPGSVFVEVPQPVVHNEMNVLKAQQKPSAYTLDSILAGFSQASVSKDTTTMSAVVEQHLSSNVRRVQTAKLVEKKEPAAPQKSDTDKLQDRTARNKDGVKYADANDFLAKTPKSTGAPRMSRAERVAMAMTRFGLEEEEDFEFED